MRRICILAIMMALVLGFSMQAQAALQNLGEDSLGNRMIYDSDLNITWYDYTTFGTWNNQVAWAESLDVSFEGTHYTNWRLPTTVDGLYDVFGYDGTTTGGYNVTTGEMGHLYYTELGNKGYYATDGTYPQTGWGLVNTDPFQTLREAYYWSSTEYSADEFDNAWAFDFWRGLQQPLDKVSGVKTYSHYALAVMDGKAVAPEPVSSTLFVIIDSRINNVLYCRLEVKYETSWKPAGIARKTFSCYLSFERGIPAG